MSRKRKNSCLSKLLNIIFTWGLVIVTVLGLQMFSKASGSILKFAQISDVHLSSAKIDKAYRLTAHSTELLNDAIQYVNDTPDVSFVAFTGDMIDVPYEKELVKFLTYANTLKYPYYTALGNHDICYGGFLNKQLYLELLKKYNKDFKFDKTYYSFSPKPDYKVIFLDNNIDTRITANGELKKEQLNWLDNELATAKNKVVLIFMHVPLKEPFSSPSHKLLDDNEMMAILKKYNNPIGIFSGHYHTTKIFQEGNIIHVSTPALISYPNAFRIITINNHKKKTVFNIEYVPTRLIELQKKSKLLVFHSSTYYGDENDRTVTLTVEKR